MKDTVYFIVISLIMVVMAYFVAFGCEKLIEKKTHVKFSSEKTKVNKLVIMAMLSAVAVVLMYFDFPLVFLAPGFYKLDFSEVPVLIGSFLLGPCAGVIIEAVKVLLHMCLKGTTTAFVGDFANADFGISTYEMTMELIRNRHTKIGIICGPTQFSSAAERLQQFKRAMASIHITVDKDYRYFLEGPHDSAFGYEALEQFLRLPHPPTALVAAHNETCIGALRYCRDHNIPIPETLSIVAPCNVNLCDLFYVQPTYALPDTWALGFRIGQMLLERIQSENQLLNREAIYIPRIIQGNSVSCPGAPR